MSELFGGASDYGSSGISSLADAQDAYSNQGRSFGPPQNTDQRAEQVISDVLANVGNRSNIRGSTNYNPVFAQAFNMSRGLQPGNRVAGDYFGADKFQGIADLARPSYLQPQVVGQRGMYFSPVERFLQETLPPIIQDIQKVTPTGIITNLINKGLEVYDKGKETFQETFAPEKESDVGIMQNMDRAEATDLQKALQFGYKNNPYSRPDLAIQTAGLNLEDIIKSPGVIGKALNYAEPFIQSVVPDTVNVDTGLIYNPEEPERSYTGIKFTIPFN